MNKSLKLVVKGHPPAFKNSKRAILDSRTGKMRTLTPKKIKQRMEAIIEDFVAQLLCISQTIEPATFQASSKLSAIASLLPADDSWQWISEINISAKEAPVGFERSEIIIEQV